MLPIPSKLFLATKVLGILLSTFAVHVFAALSLEAPAQAQSPNPTLYTISGQAPSDSKLEGNGPLQWAVRFNTPLDKIDITNADTWVSNLTVRVIDVKRKRDLVSGLPIPVSALHTFSARRADNNTLIFSTSDRATIKRLVLGRVSKSLLDGVDQLQLAISLDRGNFENLPLVLSGVKKAPKNTLEQSETSLYYTLPVAEPVKSVTSLPLSVQRVDGTAGLFLPITKSAAPASKQTGTDLGRRGINTGPYFMQLRITNTDDTYSINFDVQKPVVSSSTMVDVPDFRALAGQTLRPGESQTITVLIEDRKTLSSATIIRDMKLTFKGVATFGKASFVVNLRDTFEGTRPSVNISGLPSLVGSAAPFTVTFDFNQPVTGFNQALFEEGGVLTHASADAFTGPYQDDVSGSRYVYRVTIIPTGTGDIGLYVPEERITSSSGAPLQSSILRTVSFDDMAAPTVKITTDVPESGFDTLASFTVTYTFSEVVEDFDEDDVQAGLTNANLVENSFAGSGSAYTATITPTGKGDVSINLGEEAVRDLVGNPIAGVDPIVIKNRIVEKTQKLVGNFVRNRMRSIASVQPELTGFMDGSGFATGGGELGNLGLNANKNGYTVNFATSLGKLWDQIDRNDAASLGMRLGGGGDVPLDSNSAAKRRGYDAWMQLYGARSTSGTSKGRLWVGYAGVHKYLHDHLLVGLMGQFDQAEETDATAGSTIEGNGWMVGPYMAARLGHNRNLFFDGRAAWGKSGNTFRQNVSTGAFDTNRWLVSGKVSGRFVAGDVTVRPALGLNYLKEEQSAFVDSLGNPIGKQAFSLGEVKFGPDFTRQMAAENGDQLELKFGVDGVWNFDMKDEIAGTTRKAEGSDEVRARLEAGVTRRTPDGKSIYLEGFYDGLGASNYSAYGGKVRLTVPLP